MFRPFPFPIGHYKPFMSTFVICTSNFESEERENLELLIRLAGAAYNPVLKQRATTHLICKRPEGKKYEKAIECDIRVVTVQWLEECIAKVRNQIFSFIMFMTGILDISYHRTHFFLPGTSRSGIKTFILWHKSIRYLRDGC